MPFAKRRAIIQESHDYATAAHEGVEGTLARMSHLWWPKMTHEVQQYVATCESCQLRKAERAKPAGYMQMHETSRPLQKVCFDYVGPLPETLNHKRFIAVGIDVFTRFVVAKATRDLTAAKFVKFFKEFGSTFSWPDTIITDNAKAFDNRDVRELCAQHNITHQFAASRHHRGNAPVERAIQSLNEKMAMIMKEDPELDWANAVAEAVLSMNMRKSKATKYAPFTLMFGRNAPLTQQSLTSDELDDFNPQEVIANNEQLSERAAANQVASHLANKVHFDERRREREISQ